MRLGLGLALTSARRAGQWSPATLFGTTDTGWFYDLYDMSTMFQDAAGTTPVTAVGQPVGLQLDKSGKGNHRSQSVSLNRPTLRQDTNGLYYLEYDGLNDSLSTSAFAWGSDKATIVAGVRKLSDAAVGIVVETSDNKNLNIGSFVLTAPENTNLNGNFAFTSGGTINAAAPPSSGVILAPATRVLSGIAEISSDTRILRLNGSQVAQNTADQGTGNYGTYPVFFGARAGTSLFFNGREYSQFAINRLLTANELSQIECYTAQRTGVTI